MQSLPRFRQLEEQTWGTLYWFLQYGNHLQKIWIPFLLCCIILSQLKTIDRWGRTEDNNIVSSGSLSYLLSANKQHNPNFLFTTWKSNHRVSIFYLIFFFVKKDHKRKWIDKLCFKLFWNLRNVKKYFWIPPRYCNFS